MKTFIMKHALTSTLSFLIIIVFCSSVFSQGITVTLTSTPFCNWNNGGDITAVVTGGTPPYSYVWSNGATWNPISGLGPGCYSVTVVDNTSLTGTANSCITFEANAVLRKQNDSCSQHQGKAWLDSLSGTAPFNIQWSNGYLGDTTYNLSAGPTYS